MHQTVQLAERDRERGKALLCRTYSSVRHTAATRGLRSLASAADDLDIDRQAAETVAASAEAVERLQALRKAVMDLRTQAQAQGLQTPSLAAVAVLATEADLHRLLVDLAELLRVEREQRISQELAQKVREDMAQLMRDWLLASSRPRHEEALGEMVALLREVLQIVMPLDDGLLTDEQIRTGQTL